MIAFDADFVSRCEGLSQVLGAQPSRRLLGRRPRRTLAGGTEATGEGDYTTGDDYRYVDWNRAARLDELVSKQFPGADQENVYLLVDVSRSMHLAAPGEPTKFELAGRLAAAVGYVALHSHDRVGLMAVPPDMRRPVPSWQGRGEVPALLRAIEAIDAGHLQTDLAGAVQQFLETEPRPGTVVLLSDLLDARGFEQPLDTLRRYDHQVFLVHLLSAADADPGAAGVVTLEDVESTATLRSVIDGHDLSHYARVFQEFCDSVRSYCHRWAIPYIQLCGETSFDSAIQRWLAFTGRL